MKPILRSLIILLFATVFLDTAASAASPYDPWSAGPPKSPDFFPISVWVQAPRNAPKYKAIGINLYVSQSGRVTDETLAELEKNQIFLVTRQRPQFMNSKTIIGWMRGDEPDNAQSLPDRKGYGPPILPEKIHADYEKLKAADPSRPILLNLGQGVAYDNYVGRGVRRNHLEDYPEYIKGSDIVSFDIYPSTHEKPEIFGNLWYVPKGVDRLREWSKDQKIAWNCIECTRIHNEQTKPTPHHVKAEVWMSLIHGSRGLIYFCHQFKPTFIEAGLLADEEMANAVGKVNTQIHSLAPVLNSPTQPALATATSSNPATPIDILCKSHNGAIYIFAVAMRDAASTGTFSIGARNGSGKVEVIDEGRILPIADGKFHDTFNGYDIHLYKVIP